MRTLVLPGERPISNNDTYAGMHWSKRQKEVNRVRMVVREVLTGEEEPYQVPVDITVTVYFSKQPLDASNIPGKLYEDALKGWLLVDDSLEYVASMKTVPRVDKNNPRVEIQITEAIG